MALNFKNFKGLFSSHLLTVKLILLAGACSAGKESACKKKKKNLPAMQETWVQSLVWEDPLEKGIPWMRAW